MTTPPKRSRCWEELCDETLPYSNGNAVFCEKHNRFSIYNEVVITMGVYHIRVPLCVAMLLERIVSNHSVKIEDFDYKNKG